MKYPSDLMNLIFLKSGHDEVKKHGREYNIVFGNFSKFCFVYTCGIYRSFGIFHPTFDNQITKYWVREAVIYVLAEFVR